MSIAVQQVIVSAVVALAGAGLSWQLWTAFRPGGAAAPGSTAENDCHGCSL
jgi:hypothetical protein